MAGAAWAEVEKVAVVSVEVGLEVAVLEAGDAVEAEMGMAESAAVAKALEV